MKHLALFPLLTTDHGRTEAHALLTQITGYTDQAHWYFVGNKQSITAYIALPPSSVSNFLLGFNGMYPYAQTKESNKIPCQPTTFFQRKKK